MKFQRPVFLFAFITVVYFAILVWIDAWDNTFAALATLGFIVPVLSLFSLISYAARYVRWHWLMSRAGYIAPLWTGMLAYVSGFAFAATPGTVGELARIRYLEPMGIPAHVVISGFVNERVFDLLAVLLIASLAATQFGIFGLVSVFVILVVVVVAFFARYPRWMRLVMAWCRQRNHHKLAKIVRSVSKGLAGLRLWMTALDISVSMVMSMVAWGLMAVAFVWMLRQLAVDTPFVISLTIFPLAILAGAASMLPGGLGSTEASVVALLAILKVPLATAAVAAIAIRLGTLWFAVLLGLVCMVYLESRNGRARIRQARERQAK